MSRSYRSYVIRVRRPADGHEPIRLDLEDLIGGGRVALLGDEARALEERLLSMLPDQPPPPPAVQEGSSDGAGLAPGGGEPHDVERSIRKGKSGVSGG